MKGLVLLFLAICVSLIGWRACSEESRKWAKQLVADNLFAFIAATVAVAIAIVVSTNTTLRLV